MSRRLLGSATSRVFVVTLLGALVVTVAVSALLLWDSRRAEYAEAERITRASAELLAYSSTIRGGLSAATAPTQESELQDATESMRAAAGVSYITVMNLDGIRYTHPDPTQIGKTYRGSIPATPVPVTEEWAGTLGPSVRTIVPVFAEDGETQLGWVSVGIVVESIGEDAADAIPLALLIGALFGAVGLFAAVVARSVTRRITGNLPPAGVREAVGAYESLRVLGDALRAQTHEHGNRLHTAVALLELDRVDEAIELLTETSQRSQSLVDLVTAPKHLDSTMSALLLGKTSQAQERGVELLVDIDPDAPRSALRPSDLVSVLGNIIDNAIDAAAVGARRPRTVEVKIRAEASGGLGIHVSDSGDGISAAQREHIFEWGYSTKASGVEGRGVGLAIASRLAREVGGRIEVSSEPTCFTLTLPVAEDADPPATQASQP